MGENFQVSLGAWQQFAVRRPPLVSQQASTGRAGVVGLGRGRELPGQPGRLAAVCGTPPAYFHSRQALVGAGLQGSCVGENFQVSLGAWQQFAVRRPPLLTADKHW